VNAREPANEIFTIHFASSPVLQFTGLPSFGLVEVRPNPVLRRPDRIVGQTILVDARPEWIPLVRLVRRRVAFHGPEVFVLVMLSVGRFGLCHRFLDLSFDRQPPLIATGEE
jgi:hypothetical protein